MNLHLIYLEPINIIFFTLVPGKSFLSDHDQCPVNKLIPGRLPTSMDPAQSAYFQVRWHH